MAWANPAPIEKQQPKSSDKDIRIGHYPKTELVLTHPPCTLSNLTLHQHPPLPATVL